MRYEEPFGDTNKYRYYRDAHIWRLRKGKMRNFQSVSFGLLVVDVAV
jgi:hypothetical protein